MTTQSLPKVTKWYSTAKASKIAADLESSEEGGWTYIIVPDEEEPDEYATVALFDSAGEFVSYWFE